MKYILALCILLVTSVAWSSARAIPKCQVQLPKKIDCELFCLDTLDCTTDASDCSAENIRCKTICETLNNLIEYLDER